MRFSEEVVGRYSFNRIFHERRGAVQQLLLVFDKKLRRFRPLLGFESVVDSLLPITQRLVLSCNLGMQLALGVSAFDLKQLFPQNVSTKAMQLVAIPLQSAASRKLAFVKTGHESAPPLCPEKFVHCLRIYRGQ